jgi:L-asparagine transporter-like permease
MRETIQKIVFFVLSMVLLFLLYRWTYDARDSDSPYVRFPDKIETFR